MTYKEFFKDKKIAVVGLGPHFEMTADVKFLVKSGADVSLYDMRSEAACRHVLAELIDAGLTKYAFSITSNVKAAKLGVGVTAAAAPADPTDSAISTASPTPTSIADDLAAVDLIILSPDMPADASFLSKARTASAQGTGEGAQGSRVRIEYPQTLFLKLSPPITLIGVLGTCGKTTVATMIYGILKKAFEEFEEQGVYYIDPDASGALCHLKKVHKGDLVVARITRSLIPAYEEARVSPHVAVFTTLSSSFSSSSASPTSTVRSFGQSPRPAPPSATIFNMLEFQTYNNFIIGNDAVIDEIRENPVIEPKAKMLRTGAGIVPPDWNVRYRGGYDRENAALAIRTAELFKIPLETTRGVLENWKGLKGRLELIKKVGGVEFYNDTAASAPAATLAALRTISENKNVVLIMGGADQKANQSYTELIENIPQYASSLILIPGSGTMSIRRNVAAIAEQAGLTCQYAHTVEDAVKMARDKSAKGSRVLFSPAFEACGVEKSRMERGEKFVKAVRGL